MKKIWTLLVAVALCFSLAACGNAGEAGAGSAENNNRSEAADTTEYNDDAAHSEPDVQQTESNEVSSDSSEIKQTAQGNETLVVYFSATGSTEGIADMIASVTGADIYEIVASEPYTTDDLNYNDNNSRTTREQNDKSVRPEIGGSIENWDSYSVVYLGHPIWWGEEPRILDTFVESYNFDGKTVIPFCTSGGSGVGSSDSNLKNNAGSGSWLEGHRFSKDASEDEIRGWINNLEIN